MMSIPSLHLTGAARWFSERQLPSRWRWPPCRALTLPCGVQHEDGRDGFSAKATAFGFVIMTLDFGAMFVLTLAAAIAQFGRLWRSVSIPLYSCGKPLTLMTEIEWRLSVPMRG